MNLDLLRSFFVVVEHGSLNQAAERLRMAQSTLTRQMHALEHEVGGRLLERTSSGVSLTAAGHVLAEGMRPALAAVDAVLERARKQARGQSARLRVGYLMSAAAEYLHPALTALRRAHPEIKVELLDLSPGEQLAALRAGHLDLALLGNAGAFVAREFFVRRLAVVPVYVGLAEQHPLATRPVIRLRDLRGELFVGAAERDVPGHNRWIVQLCRRAGFRPRFVPDAESLTHALATIVTENALALVPAYSTKTDVPGVVFRPLEAPGAQWELSVAWQRGKASAPVRAMVEALTAPRGRPGKE